MAIKSDIELGARYRQITGRSRKGESLIVFRVFAGGVSIRYESDGSTKDVSWTMWTPKHFEKIGK